MHFVSELVADKGRRVFTIHPSATVLDAVREMDQRQVGSLAVVVEGRLVGIITERDLIRVAAMLFEKHLRESDGE